MTFTYNENNIILNGDIWSDPTKGGTATGPIMVTQDGVVSNSAGNALGLESGAFKVTVNGVVSSTSGSGFYLLTSALSSITVGSTGAVGGFNNAIFAFGASNIVNSGAISASKVGIFSGGGSITNNAGATITGLGALFSPVAAEAIVMDGATKVTNKGLISGSLVTYWLGFGALTLDNSGTIDGRIYLGSGLNDVLKNSGLITGDVETGDGKDKFTNTGHVSGEISLWAGDDIFIGGKFAETVRDEDGTDDYKLGDGIDLFKAVAAGSGTGTDKVDGGANAGIDIANGIYGDIYDASNAIDGLHINLDTKIHEAMAAATAVGTDVGTDLIKGFETVKGGAGFDNIYGDKAANALFGAGGTDRLYGGAGNDLIDGGTGVDFISGGAGADRLRGGSEADYFTYDAVSESTVALSGRDTILDFEDGLDKIATPFVDAPGIEFVGGESFTAGDPNVQVRAIRTGTGWTIQFDSNGDKKIDMAIDVLDTGHSISWDALDFALPA